MKKRLCHKMKNKKKSNVRNVIKKVGITLSAATLLAISVPQMDYAATSAYVNVKSANVRQKPVDGENITSLPYGTYMQVHETQQGSDGLAWSKVEFSNQGKSIVGWVRSDLIISAAEADAQNAKQQEAAAETKTDTTQEGNSDTESAKTGSDATGADSETDTAEYEQDDTENDTEAAKETEVTELPEESSAASESPLQEDGTVTIGSLTLKINEEFTAEDIPIDFSAADVEFQGETYKGVSYNNGDLKALYLVDQDKNVGAFYICDDKTASIYPFVRITYGSGYLILLQNDDDFELPDGSEPTIIALDNGTQLKAFWHLGDEQASDFYEVYTMNEAGACGWYSYDNVDKTCQRLNIQDYSAKIKNLNDSYNKLKKQNEEQRKGFHKIIAGVGLIVILLLFACLNSMLKVPAKKKKKQAQPYREKPARKKQIDAEEVKKVIAAEVEEAEERRTAEKEEKVSAKEAEAKAAEDASVLDRYMAALEKVSQTAEDKENPPKASFIQKAKDVQEDSQREIKERLNAVGKEETEVSKKVPLEPKKQKKAQPRGSKPAQKKTTKNANPSEQHSSAKKAVQRAEHLVAAQTDGHRNYTRTKDVYSDTVKKEILHEDITKNPVEPSDEEELEIMDLTNL